MPNRKSQLGLFYVYITNKEVRNIKGSALENKGKEYIEERNSCLKNALECF
jgi:hypothetical protein